MEGEDTEWEQEGKISSPVCSVRERTMVYGGTGEHQEEEVVVVVVG